MPLEALITILGMAAVTYAIRAGGLLLANRPVAPHADVHEATLAPFEARVYRLPRPRRQEKGRLNAQ